MELHVGEMGPPAVERPHRLQERPPVARQAEVRRVHVERMRQPNCLHRVGEPLEETPGREVMAGNRRIEVMMVAAALPPEHRAARISDFDSPAAACANRIADEPLRLACVAAIKGVEHRHVIGCEQINPLVEDW